MASGMHTIVVDPAHVAWEGEASSVVLGLHDGEAGFLPGHAEGVFSLAPCITRIQPASGGPVVRLFLSGGVARVVNSTLHVLAETAEDAQTVNVEEAIREKEAALALLSQRSRDVNYEAAQLRLRMALYKLLLRR